MREHPVCPWWIGYLLASPIRRWWQNPAKILGPYVRPGMTVVEPGPGMGFYTLELASLVGPRGRVVAVDIQPKMLDGLRRRLRKAGLAGRVDVRLARPESLGLQDLDGEADLVAALAVVHEMPSAERFFQQAAQCLKPGGRVLLAEPSGHVKEPEFEEEVSEAQKQGLRVDARPAMRRSRAVLLNKP